MKLSKKLNLQYVLVAFIFLFSAALIFVSLQTRVHADDVFVEIEPQIIESDESEEDDEEDFSIEMIREGAKYVTIFDGESRLKVKSEAGTVGEVLDKAGIVINEGDLVEPKLNAEIDMDNFFINIYRARPVMIKDGKTTKYAMAAGFDPKAIAKRAGLTIYDGDEVKLVPNGSFLEVGVANLYEVKRGGGQIVKEEVEIPFTETTIKDYNLKPGTSEVRQLGEVGMKEVSYKVLSVDGEEVSRTFISEVIKREPVGRIVAVGASKIEQKPLTPQMGRNRYTVTLADGRVIERQETFYDLNMSGVIRFCGSSYSVRADGVKIDQDGYVLVAANLSRYPRCSVVETSLGLGKVYDTGTFATTNPEQFDIATDWTNRNGV